MVKAIMDQLIRYGEVRRGQLGVLIQDVTQELADALQLKHTNGAVIAQVVEGSPAEKAGLKVGDMVTAVNDEPVKNSAQLRNEIGLLSIGSTVTLKIVRSGKPRKVKVIIAAPKQAKAEASSINERLAGAKLSAIGAGHPLAGRVEGVEVTNVDRGSRAAAAGLRQGDIIVSVNRHPVKSLKDFRQAVKKSGNGLLLNILRGDGALFIVIP